MIRALSILLAIATLGTFRVARVKEFLRRCVNRGIGFLLRLRSRDFVIAERTTTLVIAPHQDDGTLGCGGLILSRRLEGHPIHVVYLTDGSASHPGHPELTPESLARLREQEGLSALRLLGVDTEAVYFLRAPDGALNRLSPEQKSDLVVKLHDRLMALGPHEVFIPYRRDGSSEHEAAFLLLLEALRGIAPRPRILEYLVWSWWNPLRLLQPLVSARCIWRLQFKGHEDVKTKALKCYRSQFEPTPPWTAPILGRDFARLFERSHEFYFEI